ncbi:hypothetical protein FOZ63_030899 [Perkinsus olseni]|uniref:Endoplasmic reticulum-Golgi intermediate compartment protein 3 n=1 Tax=Perkinsus olseni TaxID=32597 RepID=A0A7J6QKA1_PEROL|nr:hypothetical protein FOZ63_030899 [Perkinsus olseni]
MKSFDMYRKLPRDLTEGTTTGATISVITLVVAIYLFISELIDYLTPQRTSRMLIEHNKEDYDSQLQINLDISFPRLPCDLLSFDAQDVMGSHSVEVSGHFFAERLTESGEVIAKDEVKASRSSGMLGQGLWSQGLFGGSGVAGESAQRVRKMLDDREGCRLVGFVKVNRVPGHIHLSSHSVSFLLGGYGSYLGGSGLYHPRANSDDDKKRYEIDMSHRVNHLSFGDEDEIRSALVAWPHADILAPLDGLAKDVKRNQLGKLEPVVFEYYTKVVPTTFISASGVQRVNQFTANSNVVPNPLLPSLYLRYDLSTISVEFVETRKSFAHFLVQVCAIVGGVFTVAGLVDALVDRSIAHMMRKATLGKLG